MKYIDADKLIAEIEKLSDCRERPEFNQMEEDAYSRALDEIKNLITSLQQEQPKFKVGDTIHKIGENTVFPMTIERIYDGDYVCVTEHQQSFINIKFQDDYELVEQEQPEVDLVPLPEEKMVCYINYCLQREEDDCNCPNCGKYVTGLLLFPYYYDSENNDVYFASVCPECGKIIISKE